MKNFKYITKENTTKELFYRLPKSFMHEPKYKKLLPLSKLLYPMLLERVALSLENCWLDAQGRAYIICEIDEIEIYLGCARGTASKALRDLDQHNLIYVAYVDTSEDSLDTHLKYHKRLVNSLKAKEKKIRKNISLKNLIIALLLKTVILKMKISHNH